MQLTSHFPVNATMQDWQPDDFRHAEVVIELQARFGAHALHVDGNSVLDHPRDGSGDRGWRRLARDLEKIHVVTPGAIIVSATTFERQRCIGSSVVVTWHFEKKCFYLWRN